MFIQKSAVLMGTK